MMTSYHGSVFRIAGSLCSTPDKESSIRSFDGFILVSVNKLSKKIIMLPVVLDAMAAMKVSV